MHFEIPTFTRCCGCLPLRRGIITLGYLSLGFAAYFIGLELWFGEAMTSHDYGMYRGTTFVAQKWLLLLLYIIEFAFIIILLVGAHMRKRRLLRIYYYYGITTCAAALAVYLLFVLWVTPQQNWGFSIVDACAVFAGLVTQLYLLLLIRSELEKPTDCLRRVNHLADVFVQPRDGLTHL